MSQVSATHAYRVAVLTRTGLEPRNSLAVLMRDELNQPVLQICGDEDNQIPDSLSCTGVGDRVETITRDAGTS